MLTKEMLMRLRARLTDEYKVVSRKRMHWMQAERDGTSERLRGESDRVSAKLDLIEDLIYLFD